MAVSEESVQEHTIRAGQGRPGRSSPDIRRLAAFCSCLETDGRSLGRRCEETAKSNRPRLENNATRGGPAIHPTQYSSARHQKVSEVSHLGTDL